MMLANESKFIWDVMKELALVDDVMRAAAASAFHADLSEIP